jgi:hypothetical protein
VSPVSCGVTGVTALVQSEFACEAVKSTPVRFAAPTVTLRVLGVNVSPDFVGVTVSVPATTPANVYLPEASAVVVAVVAPLSFTVTPAPFVMVPETLTGAEVVKTTSTQ